jgi:hypothetical protein
LGRGCVGAGEKVAVVFVPSDESAAEAQAYFAEAHGDWLMVPFNDEARWALKKRQVMAGRVQGTFKLPSFVQ